MGARVIPPAMHADRDIPSVMAWIDGDDTVTPVRDLCGINTVSTVPVPRPPAPVDLTELASDLRDLGLHTAARLVLEGRREYAPSIIEDIGGDRMGAAGSLAARENPVRALLAAQVRAWGEGRDQAVLASNLAWCGTSQSNGCTDCGHAALVSGNPTTQCNDCRENG